MIGLEGRTGKGECELLGSFCGQDSGFFELIHILRNSGMTPVARVVCCTHESGNRKDGGRIMGRLTQLLEKLVFFVAGLVLIFIAHVSRGQAATLELAELDSGLLPEIVHVVGQEN